MARSKFLTASHTENDLKNFITQVHALKSASASIGAARFSEEAGELEDAGRRGDAAFIRERIEAFRENLVNLLLHITAALNEKASESGPKSSTENISQLLMQLKDALEAEDVRTADAIMAEFLSASASLEPRMKKAVSNVSDLVLIS